MTERRSSQPPSGDQPERLRADYETAKAAVSEVGFTCEGSLIERYTCCKNPHCRCADPEQRHGPYWQLSWKENGKTISRLLSAEDAAIYQEWITNRRRLEAALEQMRDLSRQAGEQILASRGRPFHGPTRPRQRRRSAP
jgi:hypothetical protein